MTPLPCPFCGSSDLSVSLGYSVGVVDYLAVECLACEATTACQPTKEEAIAKWNRRPQDAAAQTPDTARLGTPSTPPAAHATASEGTTSDAAAPIEAVLAELVAANENMEATERMVRKKYAPPSDMAYGQTHSFTIQFPDPDMTAAGQRLFLAWRDARLANGGTVTADDPDTEPGVL